MNTSHLRIESSYSDERQRGTKRANWLYGPSAILTLRQEAPSTLRFFVGARHTAFALVTNNRRSMPVHLADHLATGHHLSVIFIVKTDLSVKQTLDDLILIACASLEREFANRITFLPVG